MDSIRLTMINKSNFMAGVMQVDVAVRLCNFLIANAELENV